MKLFRSRGVTSLPDNFTIQQKKSCFWKAIFKILFKKQSSLLLNGEVIWQASDSPFSKELHGLVVLLEDNLITTFRYRRFCELDI